MKEIVSGYLCSHCGTPLTNFDHFLQNWGCLNCRKIFVIDPERDGELKPACYFCYSPVYLIKLHYGVSSLCSNPACERYELSSISPDGAFITVRNINIDEERKSGSHTYFNYHIDLKFGVRLGRKYDEVDHLERGNQLNQIYALFQNILFERGYRLLKDGHIKNFRDKPYDKLFCQSCQSNFVNFQDIIACNCWSGFYPPIRECDACHGRLFFQKRPRSYGVFVYCEDPHCPAYSVTSDFHFTFHQYYNRTELVYNSRHYYSTEPSDYELAVTSSDTCLYSILKQVALSYGLKVSANRKFYFRTNFY